MTADGHHGLSCRYGSGRHVRHSQVNELISRAFTSAGTLAKLEPQSMCLGGNQRPDGVTLVPWKRGRCLAWDATCPNTFAQSHIQASSTQAGSAAATAEAKKVRKYASIIGGVDFVPFAVETSGVWGEIGRRNTAVRSTSFLRQRISVAVQRGNTACVLGTFPSNSHGEGTAVP